MIQAHQAKQNAWKAAEVPMFVWFSKKTWNLVEVPESFGFQRLRRFKFPGRNAKKRGLWHRCGGGGGRADFRVSVSFSDRSLILVYLCGTVQSVQFALPFMLCKLVNLQTHPFCIHLTRRKHKISYFFVHKMSILYFNF